MPPAEKNHPAMSQPAAAACCGAAEWGGWTGGGRVYMPNIIRTPIVFFCPQRADCRRRPRRTACSSCRVVRAAQYAVEISHGVH